MPDYKRTAHLLPSRIILLAATIGTVVALVGTAATAAAISAGPTITSALQPGQTDSNIGPANVGLSAFAAPLGAPALGPAEAPQPGQSYSAVASENVVVSVGGPTEALQPGQTDSAAATGNGSVPVFAAVVTPASGPSEAPQPGQTGS